MLVWLGVQTFWSLRPQKVHIHTHSHSDQPFSISSRLPRLRLIVQTLAGTAIVVLGLVLIYQIDISEGLLSHLWNAL